MATVYALGSNGSGQLGIGHTEDVSVPKEVLWTEGPPPSVSRIAAGGNHTLILSNDGDLFWSGDSTSGACGIARSTEKPATRFSKVVVCREDEPTEKSTIRLVAATWEASAFTMLDNKGQNTKVFTCGLGQKGELGQGPMIIRDPRASQLQNFPPPGTEVVDLSACVSHVVAVLSNGDVYGWGNGRKGQLGSPEAILFSPRKIEGIGFAAKRAVCGKDFTCIIGDSQHGQLLVLGQDKWDITSDAPATAPEWKDIGAGWGNIFVLKKDGHILSWGRNDYSQSVVPSPHTTSRIAIGSEHALALFDSGDVLAWGWGEHGNCGPQNKAGQDVKGIRNVVASSKYLPPGTSIAAIGAGCATSWIIIETVQE